MPTAHKRKCQHCGHVTRWTEQEWQAWGATYSGGYFRGQYSCPECEYPDESEDEFDAIMLDAAGIREAML